MSDQHEPVRLRDAHSGADPQLRKLLQSASQAMPGPAHKHALDDAILKRIAAQAEIGGTTASPVTAGGGRGIAKWLVVVGLASTVGLGVAWKSREAVTSSSSTRDLSEPAAASDVDKPAAVGSKPPTAAKGSVPAAEGGEPVRARADVPAVPAAPAQPATTETPAHVLRRTRSQQQRFAGKAEAISVEPSPHESSAAPDQTSVAPELELLARAQRALRADPQEALELTALHARAYPTGAFVEEREAIAVEALLATGQVAEGQERGRAFLQQHKGSAYAARLARLLRNNAD